jgi:hypothetical protein
MLPTSHVLKRGDYNDESLDPRLKRNIKKFYKNHEIVETGETGGAGEIDKIHNSKIVHSLDFSNTADFISELNPSYISSHISKEYTSINSSHKNIFYPFSDKTSEHLTHDLDDILDNISHEGVDLTTSEIMIEICVYRINKHTHRPFLEFMLYKSDSDDTFYFPNFIYHASKYSILEKATGLLTNILGESHVTFKGRIIETEKINKISTVALNNRVILLFEYLETKNNNNSFGVVHLSHTDTLWWATVSEIFNVKKILFYDISNTVTDVFLSYPGMIKLYYKTILIETPTVVYNGNNHNIAKYNAIFSLKRAPSKSRYGPFYYFTDLQNSMRYACYDYSTNQKYEKGGLVRFILFPGKMRVFSLHDKLDTSEMAKVIFENDPFEKNTGQFRDNDCKWTSQYNSAYNGNYNIEYDPNKYELSDNADSSDRDSEDSEYSEDIEDTKSVIDGGKNKKKLKNKFIKLAMRICIDDYSLQAPISYHYIDTNNIPKRYENDFINYKII